MKPKFIAFLLLVTVSACLPDKKGDVEPDLAGTYKVSQISSGTILVNLPDGTGTTATAVVSRPSDSQIDVTVNVTENGFTDASDFGILAIRKASGKDYDIFDSSGSTRLGSINGTDFKLDFNSNGDRFVLTAKK